MSPRRLSTRALAAAAALSALCLLALVSCSGQKSRITKEQVSAFLERMDQAARNKDVAALMTAFSEDAKFKVTIEGSERVPTFTFSMNREIYERHMRDTLGVVEKYDSKRGHTVINIEPDGQTAFVADELFETMTIKGQVIRSIARGTATLKLENGNLVITECDIAGRELRSETNPLRSEF